MIEGQVNEADDDEMLMIYRNSQYHDDTSLINTLQNKKNVFTILSLNCQSLNAKFNLLNLYLRHLSLFYCHFSAICLQETWLSEFQDLSLLQLEGYNLVTRHASSSAHGGVCIYIKENFKYKILNIADDPDVWDGLFIEVTDEASGNSVLNKKLIIGNIYRPPRENINNQQTFIDNIDRILSNFQYNRYEVAVMGDFNFDLLKLKEKPVINEYFETIMTNGFIPKITFPTRITRQSSTLIDNIFLKLTQQNINSTAGILQHQISDHQPCFIALDNFKFNYNPTRHVKIFPNDINSINRFKADIGSCELIETINKSENGDPNHNYDIISNVISKAINKHLPIKEVRYNRNRHKKSRWITTGIVNSIRYRNNLYKKLHSTPRSSTEYLNQEINLRTFNRILNQSIRNAKRIYYHHCVDRYKSDIKKTWDIIKEILNKNLNKNDYPKSFMLNDNSCHDFDIIVNEFNKYFANVGPDLASKINTPIGSFRHFLTPTNHTFSFQNITTEAIKQIISKLKNKSSSGTDQLSNKLLKLISDYIAEPLKIIINQTFKTGIFPKKLKVAKIIPIYKKGDNRILSNYRPISILPSVSKVFERVMHDQLHEYFTQHKLYYDSQYGFRPKHSTEFAALEIADRMGNCSPASELVSLDGLVDKGTLYQFSLYQTI